MRKLASLLVISLSIVAAAYAQLPRKGWLGAQLAPLTDEQRKQNGDTKFGMTIAGLLPGGTAANGLEQGDILVWLDGNIENAQQIGAVFGKSMPGSKVEARVFRQGKPQSLSLTVAEKPREKGDNYDVLYEGVVSNGAKLRMLVSKPKTPGKHPVIFLIQGIGYVTMDTPLNAAGPYARILKHFSDKAFVTVRMDKPGLGDSEGGPANGVD